MPREELFEAIKAAQYAARRFDREMERVAKKMRTHSGSVPQFALSAFQEMCTTFAASLDSTTEAAKNWTNQAGI
jgi:hypothetical protein